MRWWTRTPGVGSLVGLSTHVHPGEMAARHRWPPAARIPIRTTAVAAPHHGRWDGGERACQNEIRARLPRRNGFGRGPGGRRYVLLISGDRHLPQEIHSAVRLCHVPQHVPGIHMNRARGCHIENEIGGDRLIGAIEQKSDKFALGVQGWRSRIASNRAATGLAGDREGADTSCSYPGIDISRKRFTAPSASAMFHSMYRAST